MLESGSHGLVKCLAALLLAFAVVCGCQGESGDKPDERGEDQFGAGPSGGSGGRDESEDSPPSDDDADTGDECRNMITELYACGGVFREGGEAIPEEVAMILCDEMPEPIACLVDCFSQFGAGNCEEYVACIAQTCNPFETI